MKDTNASTGRAAALFLALVLIAGAAAMNFLSWERAPSGPSEARIAARQATGGAQSLEDVLARQRGERVDDAYRRAQRGRDAPSAEMRRSLGPLGAASNADVFRALRFGTADVAVTTRRDVDEVLVQDGGMTWLRFRDGPLQTYALRALGGMVALVALFYLARGRIRIEGGRSGRLVTRFSGVERFGHWLLATSFLVLALTGAASLFGRHALIPLIGRDAYAGVADVGKLVHNNVSWAFMAGLILVFAMWVAQNIPGWTDVKWLAKGGGFFGAGHAPSRKFNAGQKIVFWAVMTMGASISITGLSLLFPFELPMFATTFAWANEAGAWVGLAPGLPETLPPQEEMQLSQLWHAAVGFALMAVIIAHIYIGTLGMEGGFEAMGTGEVDVNWAREHHDLWVEELERKGRAPGEAAAPAE